MQDGNGLSDDALVRAVLGGNAEAYGVLVERYGPRLLGLAVSLCGDYDTAADLAQEALVAAYDALDRIRNPASFSSWIAAILRNKYRNLFRGNHTPTLSLDQLMDAGFEPPGPAEPDGPSDEDLREVMRCVEALPEKYRETLLLRYSDDLSYKQIAEFLGLPVTTVTARLCRARKALVAKARETGLL